MDQPRRRTKIEEAKIEKIGKSQTICKTQSPGGQMRAAIYTRGGRGEPTDYKPPSSA